MKKSNQVEKIAHITIGVSDLKKSMHFYQDILGLEKFGEWPAYAIFDIAGASFGLELKGKMEICLLVDDVDKAYQNLRGKEAKFVMEPKEPSWGGRAATLLDPDGNRVTIESFHCKVCGKVCQSYREFVEDHLRKHR